MKTQRFRIREIRGQDGESSTFVIDEYVTPQGLYIVLPDYYSKKESARAEIERLLTSTKE